MPFELHAVIIDKKIPLEKAKQIAQDIIKDKSKSFYRVTDKSYRFRKFPKTKFKPNSFRSRVVNDNITLVFGEMK